jgi:hypothetical protein
MITVLGILPQYSNMWLCLCLAALLVGTDNLVSCAVNQIPCWEFHFHFISDCVMALGCDSAFHGWEVSNNGMMWWKGAESTAQYWWFGRWNGFSQEDPWCGCWWLCLWLILAAKGSKSKAHAQAPWPSLSCCTCAETRAPGVWSNLLGQREFARFGGQWYVLVNLLISQRTPSWRFWICGSGVLRLGGTWAHPLRFLDSCVMVGWQDGTVCVEKGCRWGWQSFS